MNYRVTIRLEGLEEFPSVLETITTSALGPDSEDNVPLARGGAQGALEWLAYRVKSQGMPTEIPLSVFTLKLKGHDKFQYDEGRLWNEQEIEASAEGERAVAIVWPKGTETSHRYRGKKEMTYRDLIKMWLDVEGAGGKVIVSKSKEDAWRKAIAWLHSKTGIKPNTELRKGDEQGIYLPGRKVVSDEVKEETAEIVAQVIADLVAQRIAVTLQESFA